MAMADSSPELEPNPDMRPEARLLNELGLGQFLDTPIPGFSTTDGQPVLGRNFLDAYTKPEVRQHTEDTIAGYFDPETTVDERAELKDYFLPILTSWLGAK